MAPGRVAVNDAGKVWTFADIDGLSTRLANALVSRGVRSGDRVAYLGANSVEFVIVMFAIAKAAGIFVPLNTRLSGHEIGYILADAEPRYLIWDEPFGEIASHEAVTALGISQIAVVETEGLPDLPALIEEGDAEPLDLPVELSDVFMLQYTSGTSGAPKGVVLTHGNVTWNVFNALIDTEITSNTVALVVPPLFHTGALNMVFLPVFMKGAQAVLHRSFDPRAVLQAIEAHQVSMFFGVPAMLLELVQHQEWHSTDLSSLSHISVGAAPPSLGLLKQLAERGLGTIQGYGLTEAAPSVTMLREHDSFRKMGSVGTPSFFTDIRLDETVGGEPGAATGEVLAQGPNVMPEYWRNPEATRAALTEDGWLRTGDVGRLDDEGFLTIVDRVKDMYISGGENIYPAEVERAIHEHPAVAVAAVVGIPHARWGEVGAAAVTVRDGATLTAEEVNEFLQARLARYKMPKVVRIVDDLPKNATGKIVKPRLREIMAPYAEEVQ